MSETIFVEGGVQYSHERIEGWHQRTYVKRYLPTGQESYGAVWVPSWAMIYPLLEHWNRSSKDWRYATS
jgi:hypothetical protein